MSDRQNEAAHWALEVRMNIGEHRDDLEEKCVACGMDRETIRPWLEARGMRPGAREATPLGRGRWARAAPAAAMSLSLFTLMGCGAAAPTPVVPVSEAVKAPDPATAKGDLNVLYDEAIYDAAVIKPGDGLTLVPLVPGPDGTFTVSTWADCRGEGAPNKCGSYAAQASVTLKWDVWVTGNNELRDKCRTWTGDIVLQIQQILGMPPPQQPIPPDTTARQFVTFSGVPAASIFRPCTDTRIDTDHCAGTTLPPTLPPNAPLDYYKWFTHQAMSSWQITPRGQAAAGFPWTRLGYTYNWAPGAPSHYGASEYVISGGSKQVTVNVASVQTAKDFCKPR